MTGAEKLIWGSPFGKRLPMAVDAVPYGRGDDRRQAMVQPALVATLRTAAAAAGLCWDRWIWARADEANLAVILSRQAFDDVLRPGGVSLRGPDFRLVAVAVQEYSAEAWLRVPGLRPDELVVDRATVTAGDAAGDLPGPPGEAGVPCGGRGAGATPFEEGVTAQAGAPGPGLRPGPVSRARPEAEGHLRPGPVSRARPDGRTPAPSRGGDGNRTRVQGFAGPCLNHSATPPRKLFQRPNDQRRRLTMDPEPWVRPDGVRRLRADDGIRTRDPHLGKVMLYQLSHVRVPASKADGRRNGARRANRTVADPGRVANSGSIFAPPANAEIPLARRPEAFTGLG